MSLVVGLPLDLVFGTTGQLAIDIFTEALSDGIKLDFACGDEVYGACTGLREFFETRGQGYVLRVPSTFRLTVARGVTMTCARAAARLLAPLGGPLRWGRRQGPAPRAGAGMGGRCWPPPPWHHLLVRRHLSSGELAFHYCFAPEGQRVSMARLIRANAARTASASANRKPGSPGRSPATRCWSWPHQRSAPSPPSCCATAPVPKRRRQCTLISRRPLTRG